MGAPSESRVTLFELTANPPGPALYEPVTVLQTPGASGGQFGWSVSLVEDSLLVGAPGEERAYHYQRESNGAWNLVEILEQPIQNAANTKFGFAVAIERNPLATPHLFVGAFQTYIGGLQYAGAVHAYPTLASGATDTPFLVTHPSPGFQDRFGVCLDAAGGALAVGTPKYRKNRYGMQHWQRAQRRNEALEPVHHRDAATEKDEAGDDAVGAKEAEEPRVARETLLRFRAAVSPHQNIEWKTVNCVPYKKGKTRRARQLGHSRPSSQKGLLCGSFAALLEDEAE